MRDLEVGKRIRQIRERLRLTQAQFGKKLGVIKVSVARYEAGRIPRLDLLHKIARLGGVPVGWLLQGDRAESVVQTSEPPFATMAQVEGIRDLFALFQTNLALERVSQLPRRYRERYRDRIKELTGRVRRELEEYRKVLEAEHRAERAKRRGAT